MLIRSLVEMAGTLWELHEDEVLDLPEPEARRLIAQGQAEPVAAECAAVMPGEVAMKSRVPHTHRIRKR